MKFTPRLLRWLAAVEVTIAVLVAFLVIKPIVDCAGPSCALLNPEHYAIRFVILLAAGLVAIFLIILAKIKERE
jgi:hypothetical protein